MNSKVDHNLIHKITIRAKNIYEHEVLDTARVMNKKKLNNFMEKRPN